MTWRTRGERKNISPENLLLISRSKYLAALAILEHNGYEFEGEAYDGNEEAVYLAGYALELILKRHIAIMLNWETYPPKTKKTGIDGYTDEDKNTSFNIHDLNRLLILSGLHTEVMSDNDLKSHWTQALNWQADIRYCEPGLVSKADAKETVDSILHMIKWIKEKTC